MKDTNYVLFEQVASKVRLNINKTSYKALYILQSIILINILSGRSNVFCLYNFEYQSYAFYVIEEEDCIVTVL